MKCVTGDCFHNLVRGITTTDLLSGDGPYKPIVRVGRGPR